MRTKFAAVCVLVFLTNQTVSWSSSESTQEINQLPIETLYGDVTTTSPADLTIGDLITILSANESLVTSGRYEMLGSTTLLQASVPFAQELSPVGLVSTQTLLFDRHKYRYKNVVGHSAGGIAFDEEWSHNGKLTYSLSEQRKGGVIRRESGQRLTKPNYFRELYSPLGFHFKGKLSQHYTNVENSRPGTYQLYYVEHPTRGRLLVSDPHHGVVAFFDPKKNYAPVGQLLFQDRDTNVLYLGWEWFDEKLVGGVYLPNRLVTTEFRPTVQEGHWSRARIDTLTFRNWEVNIQIPDKDFDLNFPITYDVYDAVNKTVIYAAPTDNKRKRIVGMIVLVLAVTAIGGFLLRRKSA